jgi:hypothetical protein
MCYSETHGAGNFKVGKRFIPMVLINLKYIFSKLNYTFVNEQLLGNESFETVEQFKYL